MKKVVLLSCGKSKLNHASPASALYVGDLFKKSLAYAESLRPDAIFILSAKHGLLELDQVIEPYEMTLNKMKKEDRLKWSQGVLSRLFQTTDFRDSEYVFLTGAKYRENLVPHLHRVSVPMEGMSFGQQLGWLKGQCMNSACCYLHEKVAELPRFSGNLDGHDVPLNGLYIIFEKGETSHGKDRIVRVGTHTGEGNLRKRIAEHLYFANKDRSVFRKHIGRCILAGRSDPFLDDWERDLTSKGEREKYQHVIDFEKQDAVEKEVTDYITNNLSICVLKMDGKAERLSTEESLLSTLAQCGECSPSPDWLGRHHPRYTFGTIGLWNVQGLKGAAMSLSEMQHLLGA